MTINDNYNSGDEEEWDMVPDSGEDVEALQVPPPPALPSAPLEEEAKEVEEVEEAAAKEEVEVMGLEEQQAKLGITDETSPEEIQKLLDEGATVSFTNEESQSIPDKEDTPLLDDTQAARESQTSTEQPQPTEPNQKLPGWLRASLGAASKALQDVEQKHDLKQKMRQVGSTIQKETEGIRTVVEHESRRLSQTVQQKAEELDIQAKAKSATESIHQSAKTAGDTISQGAKTAGDKAKELNKDGKVTQFVAAAAVVGASIFLASKGKPGAGAAVMATGGAAFMASEAANSGARRYEQGLNEDLHMD